MYVFKRRVRLRRLIYLGVIILSVTLLLYVRFQITFPNSSINYMSTIAPLLQSTGVADTEQFAVGLADPAHLLNTLIMAHGNHLASREIWPSANFSANHDSLLKQLRFLDLLENSKIKTRARMAKLPRLHAHPKDKFILVTAGVSVDPWQLKREAFIADKCPITNCYLMEDLSQLPPGLVRPDAVVYKTAVSHLTKISAGRLPHEIWVVWQLESPLYASMAKFRPSQSPNWTASYRSDSTLVSPYDKYLTSTLLQHHNLHHLAKPLAAHDADVSGRRKLVAWFVTNCRTQNGRLHYVNELKKHIQVDVYGGCGPYKCPKQDPECLAMLSDQYKFYLAFENSDCRQYITEKLYENAYGNDVIPVVMGAHPDDYRAVAPPHSYIHVDDFASPRHLADYLKLLDKNDTLYNEYFRWKGTGSFINTKFWCRLCAMLHARDQTNYIHSYGNLAKWWREDQCVLPKGPYGATWRTQ